jgi:hypothetical protein
MARASLMESQNHLIDAVDSGYMAEEVRSELNAMAEVSLEEVTGLMEYLQSPEALKNARKARERRIALRPDRTANLGTRTRNREPRNPAPGTPNSERRTPNSEPRTPNSEFRTPNREPRTPNSELRTANPEFRTRNAAPNLNTNREP